MKKILIFFAGLVCGFSLFLPLVFWVSGLENTNENLQKIKQIATQDYSQQIQEKFIDLKENFQKKDIEKENIFQVRQEKVEQLQVVENNIKADFNSHDKIDKHLNKLTNNTNILCLGINEKKLEMVSVYSINKENKKSAGIFLPTRTSVLVNGNLLTLAEIYREYGVKNLKKIISQCMEIEIPYYMEIDKNGLVQLSELIGPIYVENENIDIPHLFERPVSPNDDQILQSLAQEITKPQMVLNYPKLIRIFINNVKSDVQIGGLWDLYNIFKGLNHSELKKVILWGKKANINGKETYLIAPYDWHNTVYKATE